MLGTTSGPKQGSPRHAGAEPGMQPADDRPPAVDPALRDAAAHGTAGEQLVLQARAVIAGHWPVSFYRPDRILQLPEHNGTEA